MARLHWIGVAQDVPSLVGGALPGRIQAFARQTLGRELANLEQHLADNEYLMGERFTVADVYCIAIVNWHRRSDLDLSPRPNLNAYMAHRGPA